MPSEEFDALRRATPARLGVGRAGPRYTTTAMLEFRADHARAVDAVMSEIPPDWPRRNGWPEFHSRAASRDQYLRFPELGRRLADNEIARLKRTCAAKQKSSRDRRPSVLVFVGDGLSSAGVVAHAPALVAALGKRLTKRYRLLPTIFIRNARVRIEDHLGEILKPDLVCMIVGERPGLMTAESLSAYVIFRPSLESLEPDRTVISNIHRGGIKPTDGARKIAALIDDAIRLSASGAQLAALLGRENPAQ
jgi:ethanolamine ammonia-lyase small subunit